jgi:hypothetical protein
VHVQLQCDIERFSLNVSFVADVHALCSGRYSKVMLCSITLDVFCTGVLLVCILAVCEHAQHITL